MQQLQKKVVDQIHANMTIFGPKTPLRDACEYALTNGGKRLRPCIVHLVADALGQGHNVMQPALAIEYFHTASLIADDLPCMDNEETRRSKPTLHKAFGESTALLASYALISAGNGCLAQGVLELPEGKRDAYICVQALKNASYNTGLYGATGGQFLDLLPPDITLESVKDIIHKKTVSFFEIAFVFGWIYGGGDSSQLPQVKKTASHFGTAFQIADDIDDAEQDLKNGCKINLANAMGLSKAQTLFNEERSAYLSSLETLCIATPALKALI